MRLFAINDAYRRSLVILLLLFFAVFDAAPAGSAEFRLKMDGSNRMMAAHGLVDVPGKKELKAGVFERLRDGRVYESMAGVLVNGKTLYLADSEGLGRPFDVEDDCDYGAHRDLFFMLCYGFAESSEYRRILFVFRVGDESVRLEDLLVPFVLDKHRPDLSADTPFKKQFGIGALSGGDKESRLIRIEDRDGDGKAELGLELEMASGYLEIYIEINDDGVKVDYAPELYRPLFEKSKKHVKEPRRHYKELFGGRPDEYYIYGHLAGEVDMETIRSEVGRNKRRLDRLIKVLESKGRWDSLLRGYGGAMPVLRVHQTDVE